jgi:hypothetical protein
VTEPIIDCQSRAVCPDGSQLAASLLPWKHGYAAMDREVASPSQPEVSPT